VAPFNSVLLVTNWFVAAGMLTAHSTVLFLVCQYCIFNEVDICCLV